MRAAKAAGLDVVALTDHDTVSGWDEASTVAAKVGITLVKGAEFSTVNGKSSQHLLGYQFDLTHARMAELLRRAALSRQERVNEMHAALEAEGVGVPRELVLGGVQPGGYPGKKHFAKALVSKAHVSSDEEAFAKYLGEGKVASIRRWKPTVEDAIETIVSAGGVAVLAHPRGRGLAVNDRARFRELRAVGLSGFELRHREHSRADRLRLRAQHPRSGPHRHRIERPSRTEQDQPRPRLLLDFATRHPKVARRPGRRGA